MELKNIPLEELWRVAQEILKKSNYSICLINGTMGSGKTTLIREICRLLGVKDNVASPTFALVNEYDSDRGPIYHFDFYRLKSLEEAFDAGIEEYFYTGQLCLLEWPELVAPILPSKFIKVDIEESENDTRNYKLTTHE